MQQVMAVLSETPSPWNDPGCTSSRHSYWWEELRLGGLCSCVWDDRPGIVPVTEYFTSDASEPVCDTLCVSLTEGEILTVAALGRSHCEEEHKGVDVSLEGGSQNKLSYKSTACKSHAPGHSLATAISVPRQG